MEYLISLSVESEEKLGHLLVKLNKLGIPVSYFQESDLDNELTSICFLETENTIKLTSSLSLALKNI